MGKKIIKLSPWPYLDLLPAVCDIMAGVFEIEGVDAPMSSGMHGGLHGGIGHTNGVSGMLINTFFSKADWSSRNNENKCIFNKRTIKVCISNCS